MALTFHRLVAMRYLKMERPRSPRVYLITWTMVAMLVVVSAAWYGINHARAMWVQQLRAEYGSWFQIAQLILIVATIQVGAFTALIRRLTIFTTISVYGLFLGTGALVIVLSVMSGFEGDLKHKI